MAEIKKGHEVSKAQAQIGTAEAMGSAQCYKSMRKKIQKSKSLEKGN